MVTVDFDLNITGPTLQWLLWEAEETSTKPTRLSLVRNQNQYQFVKYKNLNLQSQPTWWENQNQYQFVKYQN